MDPITASMIFTGVSTVMSAGSAMAQGDAAQMAANRQAQQLEEQADEEFAASTREAQARKSEAERLLSTARARAAAGSGSSGDVGMTERLAEISSQGDYNALAAMFEGKAKRRSLIDQAEVRKWEGDVAKKESRTKALSTVLSGGNKIYQTGSGKYWNKGGS